MTVITWRAQVPKLEALYGIVESLAALKYNQFQLYMEHTFAYKDHPFVALTAQAPHVCNSLQRCVA